MLDLDLPDGLDVLSSADAATRQASFWNTDPMQAACIVRPKDAAQVAAAVKAARASGRKVVTHGGRTGCADATRSTTRDVVLSMEKMNRIVEIDPIEGVAIVEAGVILATLHDALASEGMMLPLDLGARGSCTIGGNVATNAGGVNVIRYGMTRNLVLGLEVVLPDGTIISALDRVLKNNAGFDLKQLFIGTEGTLGVVTRIALRIEPAATGRRSALLTAGAFADVLSLLALARKTLGSKLVCYEAMWGDYYDRVTAPGGHRPPLDRGAAYYVLVEADLDEGDAAFDRLLERAFEAETVTDGAIAQSEGDRADFWRVRDDFEAITSVPNTFLYDVSLPLRKMEGYVAEVKDRLSAQDPDGVVHVFGHIGDGNLHLFVRPSGRDRTEEKARSVADPCVYEPLRALGGSVSAEHGIGHEKKAWLSITRSEAEIDLMRRIKAMMDPEATLNPGVVFD